MVSSCPRNTGPVTSSGIKTRNRAACRRQMSFSSSLTRPLVMALLLLFHCNMSSVWGISRCNQYQLASGSITSPSRSVGSSHGYYSPHSLHSFNRRRGPPKTTTNARIASPSLFKRRRRRGPRMNSNNNDNNDIESDEHDPYLEETQPVLRIRRKKAEASENGKNTGAADNSDNNSDPFATPMSSAEIYSQLGPVGKCVAGTTEIAVSTCMEYITGFMGGYVLGSITDVPRFAFKQVDPTNNPNNPFLKELAQRYGRMHQKSFRWAKSWGGVSAAFGGFRVATRVIRGGKEDEWNTVFSSAAAGAFFARNEGPKGMLRGAITYGGLMYLLSGGMGRKKEPFEYSEQPLDF